MSILSSILTETVMYIATDTVVCRSNSKGETPYPGILIGHHSKIVHHPHLRCSVACMGSHELSVQHDVFVRSNFFDGIEDLYNRTIKEFVPSIANRGEYIEGEDNMIGAISFFGQHEYEKKLAAYNVQVLRGDIVKSSRPELDLPDGNIATLMTPRLPIEEEESIMDNVMANGGNAVQVLYEICEKLVENSSDPEKFVFPVGGQFVITTISIENGFYSTMTSNLANFKNWDVTEAKIALYNDSIKQMKLLQDQIQLCEQQIARLDSLSLDKL